LRRILTAAVLAAAVTVTTACAPQEPAPVSAKVQDFYEKNVVNATSTPAPDTNQVVVIGDSYVFGSDVGGKDIHNWTYLTQGALQGKLTTDVLNAAVGGSGYVVPGPKNKTFAEALPNAVGPKTDLVVFFGSRNDRAMGAAKIEAAATAAYSDAKKLAPKAKLLVVGPPWPNADVPVEMFTTRDALKAAADKAGAAWVDPLAERWFFDQPALIGSDKTHPTDEGHAYVAKLLVPRMKKALGL
jgi:lysophospholipase L1-like esterase